MTINFSQKENKKPFYPHILLLYKCVNTTNSSMAKQLDLVFNVIISLSLV